MRQKWIRLIVLLMISMLLQPQQTLGMEYPFLLPGGTNPIGNYGEQLENLFGNAAEAIDQSVPQSVNSQATPNTSGVAIDGKRVVVEAYTINGYNYFKLRDLSMALNGSSKQFDVTWDNSKNAINIVTESAYTVAGGELVKTSQTGNAAAVASTSKLYLNGQEVNLNAYIINNYTYFKLRDVGQAINFGVTWDASANAIKIDTSSDYDVSP